jgi:hypothetical protein
MTSHEPPPHNAEAEVALLGSLLLNPEAMPKVGTIVRPDDFYVTVNRITYRAMFRLHLDGKVPDPVLVLSELARSGDLEEIGGKAQLATYARASSDGTLVEEYARLVRESAAKRMLDGLADDLKHAARNGVASVDASTKFARDIADVRDLFYGDGDHVDLFEPIVVTEADLTPWVVRGYLARRAVTLMSALPKCGKTTIAYAIAAALQRGDPEWCGLALPESCDVLVMTEEDDSVLAETFKAVRLDPSRVPTVTRRKAFPRRPLARDVDMAIKAITKRPSIGLVILDTWRFWANLPDKGSNDADIVGRAFQEVARLAAAGVAVLLLHHSRKADGDEGTAASGSNALTGAADILIELRRFGKGEDSTIRAIKAYGRFQRIPEEKVVDFRDGRYHDLGEADQARDRMKEGRVGQWLLSCGKWVTSDEVAEGTGMKAAAALAALKGMVAKGEVQRVGKGARGAPFLYASLNVPLHQQPPTGE